MYNGFKETPSQWEIRKTSSQTLKFIFVIIISRLCYVDRDLSV